MRDVDLHLEPGERVLVLGPSGAGKSTLAAALAGILVEGETAGTLRVDGRVGLVQQDPEAQIVLSRVGDEVAFGCENLAVPPDEIWPRVRSALDAVGLAVPLGHSTAELSGGQQQRLALAGALAMRPGLLVLDEPTANLDPAGVIEVRNAVARATADRGITLVVIEHRVETWLPLVDRVVVLTAEGGLLADGPPDAVLSAARAELDAAGVWLPGWVPRRARPVVPRGVALLRAGALSVGRTPFGGRQPVVAASGIGLEARSGRALAITGPNGSGKTTLALTLGGLLTPVAGEVVAAAALAQGIRADPARWRPRQLAPRIGSVFQNPEHQFVRATVREEVLLGATPRRADELLGRLRLTRLAEANPFTLSGGEKRRLSVATALAAAPPVLILDEPTFGQDRRTWGELVALLAGLLDDGVSVVAVTHDRAFVDALADDESPLGGER